MENWVDQVENDATALEAREGKAKYRDRKEWRKITRAINNNEKETKSNPHQ